jgi:tetratricopeptide (TPR) repeat protein
MKSYQLRIVTMLSVFFVLAHAHAQQAAYQVKELTIPTRWTKLVSPNNALPEYPRPQMVRANWKNLNGLWQYAITPANAQAPQQFDGKILVPYPLESALSGVKKSLGPEERLWYKKTITKPTLANGEKLLLHFGAVDYEATVYINGTEAAKHTGGYETFSIDITPYLKQGANELLVKVWDPTDLGPNPHGKQVLNPSGIMYTPSSGIWQTVWLETVPQNYIASVRFTPDVDKSLVNLEVTTAEPINVQIKVDGITVNGKTNSTINVPVKNAKLWSPNQPYLYDVVINAGKDVVKTYFGMRKIEIKKDDKGIERIFLNNKYTYNLGTLDQGFWPDGLYTAPTDEALAFDIKAIKAMGFNTIRKHIKVEPARWYYYCDKLGMLVWQDMVNPPNDNPDSRAAFETQNKGIIDQLFNHPSIVSWVLFNEGWGTYDQPRLTKWMKEYDATRIINGHSGENYHHSRKPVPENEQWAYSDVTDIHAYPPPAMPPYKQGKAIVLGEFGGIAVAVENHLWNPLQAGFGYGNVVNPTQMAINYGQMTDTLVSLEKRGLSGSIYTQPFDVEGEQNGLMSYDRAVIKLPVATLRKLNARLWPVTENYVAATKGFGAIVADTASKALVARLKEYNNGKKDSAFLLNLMVIADKEKDKQTVARVATDYWKQVKDPFNATNVAVAAKYTHTSKEPTYLFLLKNLHEITKRKLSREAPYVVQGIIFAEEVRPLLNENPDWNAVEAVLKKYPQTDGEFIIGNAVVYYLNALSTPQKNASKNLVHIATIYDDRYHGGRYNDWAWQLFLTTDNKEELTKALEWSKKEIERLGPAHTDYGGAVDTYANLLYKLGNVQEALKWQEKAVAASPNNGEITDAYKKMKAGQPTWPTP